MRLPCLHAFLQTMALSGVLWAAAVLPARADDLQVEIGTDREDYAPGDTVIVILSCVVPRGYYLCANPLGPGIGKRLEVSVGASTDIRWLHLRSGKPSRHGDGDDWIWVYRRRPSFYLTGVVAASAPPLVSDSVTFSGLMCRTACVRIDRTVSFVIRVSPDASGEKFDLDPFEQSDYERGIDVPLTIGVRTTPSPPAAAVDIPDTADTHVSQTVDTGLQAPGETISPGTADTAAERPAETVTVAAAAPDTPSAPPKVWKSERTTWEYTPREDRLAYSLWLAIVLGFLAGVLLNVMPCVLPVLGIKILSFSQASGGSRRVAVQHSLVFAAGMVAVFLGLATLAAFAQFSWGEQFRHPWMVSAIICAIVVFALGLFDLYMLMVPATSGGQSTVKEGYAGDFARGMFATVMATPCSGPLLGATLAWTLTQSAGIIYAVFTAVGLGMALPYVALAASKTLLRLVPRPGPWMDDFKHAMGFVLLGFAIYLLTGLRAGMIVSTLTAVLALTIGIAVYRRYAPFGSPVVRRTVVAAVSVALAAGGVYFSYGVVHPTFSTRDDAEEPAGLHWRTFSPEALETAHLRGDHALVDFTATWCMNCQYNKAVVLHSALVAEMLKRKDVVLFKADLTKENPTAESLLEHLGSRSVPFLAIFPGHDPYNPLIMRDVISRREVLDALEQLPEK